MATPDNEGFLQLWPTTLVQRILPGHEGANVALAEYIDRLEAANSDLTTDYLADNFMAHEHPAVQWLKECANKTVVDYLQRQGLDYAINWSLAGLGERQSIWRLP